MGQTSLQPGNGVLIVPLGQESNEKAGSREISFCFMSVHFLQASFCALISNIQEGLGGPDLN